MQQLWSHILASVNLRNPKSNNMHNKKNQSNSNLNEKAVVQLNNSLQVN